jgi:hypothetical protein
MRRGAQRPHMHVKFVGQDLKRHPIRQWLFRLERLCSADDNRWRYPSAGIPCAEGFDSDTKGRRAERWSPVRISFRTEADLESRRCHRSAPGWKRMDGDENPRLVADSEMRQNLRKVFQLVGSDRSR